jgi:hypothetical protein
MANFWPVPATCPIGAELALVAGRKAVTVSHRMIELLIGRPITDEGFRGEFLDDPERTVRALCDRGLDLVRS